MNEGKPQRVVVMTGGTSGLGAHAARHLADQPGTRLLVGVRGSGRTVPPGAEMVPLDLASLESVRSFADAVIRELGDDQIDIMVLNAGLQNRNADVRSAEGYELTFAANHLGHYLLARLLVPHMAEHGRLVITTSDTHDPEVAPMGPKTLDVDALAHAQKSGLRAYASSKLCNIMTAQSLAQQEDVKARHIEVLAFNPGLTGGTGLGRDGGAVAKVLVTVMMATVFRVVALFKPEFTRGTAENAGRKLADVAEGKIVFPPGRMYVSLVKGEPTFPEPSELSRNPEKQHELWQESAVLAGMA
jgi:NAD(P)-dependent dehydrogenase (short-subunit alcohol dehydrogenase family)